MRHLTTRSAALAAVCLLAAGVALWRWYAGAFPSYERWDAPASCAGAVGVYGAVAREGIICAAGPLSFAEAVRLAGGARCAVDAADAARAADPGDKITVTAAGGRCVLVASRFSGHELLALGMPIDINTATAADIEALPAIGPALSGRIVEHRDANGRFAAPEAIMDVRGIGPAIYAKIKDKITVPRSR